MAKIFAERKIKASMILPLGEYKLFSDMSSTDFVPEKIERIVESAKKHLETDIPTLPATYYLDFYRNGNRSRFESIAGIRRRMMLELALAEMHERQGRFTEKLADVVWATLEESTWVLPAHLAGNYPTHNEFGLPAAFGEGRLHGIDIISAPIAALLAMIYDNLKSELDALCPVICEKIEYAVRERVVTPFISCSFWWTGERGGKPNNWCPWTVSNILYATALVERDEYLRGRVFAKAIASLDNFTNGYKPDGGCDEGPGYWGAAGASYFDCLELLYDISGGAIDVYDHPLVKNMLEYVVKFNIDGKDRFINFADCAPRSKHDGAMIRRMGEKCGSETLIAFGDVMANLGSSNAWSHLYRMQKNLMTEKPEAAAPKADQKIWFPDLKVMIARESEDPSVGMFVAMKGGNNAESHNHNDIGNFVVYYNGNPVLIDTGAGQYTKQTFSADRYKLWFMQSHYHNLPAFDGIGQMQGGAFRSQDEVYDEASGGVSMQLKDAYLPEAGLITYNRSAALTDEGAVVITDEIELTGTREIDFRFMSAVKPEFDKDGNITLAEGRKMAFDKSLKASIEEFDVEDIGIENKWGSKQLYRIHLSAKADKCKYTFTIV